MADEENHSREHARNVVENFMQVFSRGNVEEILSCMTDDATWWVAGTLDGISGTKSKAEFGEMVGSISSGSVTGAITLTPQAWTVDPPRVAVETESFCELKNGRVYNNIYHFLFEVEGDKVRRVKEFLDTEHTRAVFLA